MSSMVENSTASRHDVNSEIHRRFLRREILKSWAGTIFAGSAFSCDFRDPTLELLAPPIGQCQDAQYALLYPNIINEEFPLLDMCGKSTTIQDVRFTPFTLLHIHGVGNRGDMLMVEYMKDTMDPSSNKLYIYDMIKHRYSVLPHTLNEVRSLRLSGDGSVIVGIEISETSSATVFEVWLRHYFVSDNVLSRVSLGTRIPTEIPRNVTISDDGKIVILSDADRILQLDTSTMTLKEVDVGFNATCSPDGSLISFTNGSGELTIRPTAMQGHKRVVGILASDGLEWYPHGSCGVVAQPSNFPPIGAPRPDNLYLVDVSQKKWRKLTIQRGWIGARSLRWIKKSIDFRAVLNGVQKEIVQ